MTMPDKKTTLTAREIIGVDITLYQLPIKERTKSK